MQEQPASPKQAPKTLSGLAITSLVCGISAFIIGPLSGIPAIITGHMALGRIKRSEGDLRGGGMATAGLVLGYVLTVIITILAVAGFAAGKAAINNAKSVTTMATATAVESAVTNFATEYGTMPSEGDSDTTLLSSKDTQLLNVLLGLESRLNTREIKFLSAREGKANRNGLIYSSDGRSVVGLFDPWGSGYRIRLDLDFDEKLNVDGEILKGRRVAVWSDGPDRVAGTEDDIKTW